VYQFKGLVLLEVVERKRIVFGQELPTHFLERTSVGVGAVWANLDIGRRFLADHIHHRPQVCRDVLQKILDLFSYISYCEELLRIDFAFPDVLVVDVKDEAPCYREAGSFVRISLQGEIVQIDFLDLGGALDFYDFPVVLADGIEYVSPGEGIA